MKSANRLCSAAFIVMWMALLGGGPAQSSDFSEPWKRPDRALVVDAYEYNPIDWHKLAGDKRIAGFINKASDGLSPPYRCSGGATEVRLCKALWKRHAVARELFQTRRTLAKSFDLKWGAYHLGRPGNPIDQANNFIEFADPAPDDLIAIDIEENDPKKWMSLEDAEIFARHIHTRLGRWPVLYTNGNTALYIAENRDRYKVLSRLPLWYARYKPVIGLHFPKGHWKTYTLWQFAAATNCDARSCPYRVPGTPLDIDVNVASMSADELRSAWPFGELVPERNHLDDRIAEAVPLPMARQVALDGGDVTLRYATIEDDAILPDALAWAAAEPANGKAEDVLRDVVELTGEKIPLPIRRSEAMKKSGDVTLSFVTVERVVAPDRMERPPAALAAYRSPFQALLRKEAETGMPVVRASYAQDAGDQFRSSNAGASAAPHYEPSGEMSTAARDEPHPAPSIMRFSRRDLPVFLISRLD